MKTNNNKTGKLWSGIMFILIGFIFLINEFFPQIDFKDFWPLLLIITGIIIIYDELQKDKKTHKPIEHQKSKNYENQ